MNGNFKLDFDPTIRSISDCLKSCIKYAEITV